MKREDFLALVESEHHKRMFILKAKGAAYSGTSDAFENFKRNGERLGLTKYQIWAVYCAKHLDSIFNAIKECPKLPIDRSEGIPGRVRDAINYLNLLQGMVLEDEVELDKKADAILAENASGNR